LAAQVLDLGGFFYFHAQLRLRAEAGDQLGEMHSRKSKPLFMFL
jgi:hypothetical protein